MPPVLGTHPPGAEAAGERLLVVPARRLVQVSRQEAAAVGVPVGLEVLGGGRDAVLAVTRPTQL